jgi:hypothetical protein
MFGADVRGILPILQRQPFQRGLQRLMSRKDLGNGAANMPFMRREQAPAKTPGQQARTT